MCAGGLPAYEREPYRAQLDTAVVDIEASDDAFGQHGREQKFLRILRPRAEDFSG